MKKVLWMSRHPLPKEAVDALAHILCSSKKIELEVTEKNVTFPASGEAAYKVFKKEAKGYDFVGGVFPSQLWMEFLRKDLEELDLLPNIFQVISVPVVAEDGKTRTFKFDHIEII